MRVRIGLLVLLVFLVTAFASFNWHLLATPVHFNFLLGFMEIPIGVLLAAVILSLGFAFGIYLVLWQGRVINDYRRQSQDQGLRYSAALSEIEREAREKKLTADGRLQLSQQRAKPIAEALRQWLTRQRGQVPDGSATRKGIDYSLGRWAALTRYLEDGDLPIDNNHVENRIRPVALGRNNWLFAGSPRAGQRAAAVMSLIQSAKLNGRDPYRYLKDGLERLPIQPISRIDELLPHGWAPL
jgi:hypothetical protein